MARIVSAIGLLVTLLAADMPAHAQTTLRYKFKPGDKLQYVLEQKIDISNSVMGRELVIKIHQTMEFSWQVKSVAANGDATMVQTFDRIRFHLEGPAGKTDYDSKNGTASSDPAGQSLGDLFTAMVGSKFGLTMNRRGEISHVTIPEKLKEALKNAPGSGGLGMDILSEDGFKRLTSQSGVVFPEEPAAKGKSWSRKTDFEMGMIGKVITRVDYTYDGSVARDGKNLEKLTTKSRLTYALDENASATMKIKDQDIQGTILFDNQAGRIVESKLTQSLSQEIGVMRNDIDQKINQTMTMKLIEK